ncbi:50S ribosomal protein L6 [Candidatus Hydrogenosomobacter endosymbioticus]|uniref:50S ribosomal protein L6 n=1 Tax=Candidatus Hydrogenosomobacter endosymbioticus TaxID=2558174 RepID=A0ABN6L368_9PROT|nr:50S ribosomal protein L6 [Candidatus Hydrogenosomobacter endosymbioticus]BDB95997.1 50S ribosomal protein L6 [Candidatus Hydrogenosomobacter endosymbioticus]
MSRISRMPIELPSGVECRVDGRVVVVSGGNGELSFSVPDAVKVVVDGRSVFVRSADDVKICDLTKEQSSLCGTVARRIKNMVVGVSSGFVKNLELIGVGYKAEYQPQASAIKLNLGLSHSIMYSVPNGIMVKTDKPTSIVVSGVDKQLVGQVAAEIRKFCPPEPYKGKGIHVDKEFVRRKEGKAK